MPCLYILRHAIAVERGTPGYSNDSKRPLTDEGKTKMRQVAKGMRNLGISFDVILCSPYIRAQKTAEIVTESFKIKNEITFSKNLIPETEESFGKLVDEIKGHLKKTKNILLVGHEPHLSGFISYLISSKPDLAINLKKGGLCSLTIDRYCSAGSAVLDWLLSPYQLSLISNSKD